MLIFLLSACSDVAPDAGRDAVLLEWLLRDNAIWRSRDPELLRSKYDVMEADAYSFMRGTVGLFYEDAARRSSARPPTAFLRVPEASSVLLVGDPHPENFGATLPGEGPGPTEGEPAPELSLEFVDLDGATFGPWILDLRRAALGVGAFVRPMEGCDAGCRDSVWRALATGYGTTVDGTYEDQGGGDLIEELLEESLEEGAERKRHGRYTTDGPDHRLLIFDEALDDEGKGLFEPGPEHLDRIDRLMAGYARDIPGTFRILDVGRRLGQGVSSRPAFRYIVLWDRGEPGPEDDDLINARELLDPPRVPGPGQPVGGSFADNADRIEAVSERIWSTPDADPRLAGLIDGTLSFKVQSWSSWYQELDHDKALERWDEGKATRVDLEQMAHTIGHHLAAAHLRSGLPDPRGDSAAAVRADLGGRIDALADEIASLAPADLDRLIDDHRRLAELRRRHGPWLGADLLVEDAWTW